MVVPSDDTAINQFTADDLDVVRCSAPRPRAACCAIRASRPACMRAPAAQITYLGMNQTQFAPFRDRRVREAFCVALDRAAMVAGLFGGLAEPLSGQITPGIGGHNPNLPPIPFDRDRARRLFAEAGFPGGQRLSAARHHGDRRATAPSRPTSPISFRQVLGITVEISVLERGTFLRNLNAGEIAVLPLGLDGGLSRRPELSRRRSGIARSPFNRARCSNPAFDTLIDQARRPARRRGALRLYPEAEPILLAIGAPAARRAHADVALVRPNVRGVDAVAVPLPARSTR